MKGRTDFIRNRIRMLRPGNSNYRKRRSVYKNWKLLMMALS